MLQKYARRRIEAGLTHILDEIALGRQPFYTSFPGYRMVRHSPYGLSGIESMTSEHPSPERLNLFSDGVFAVIITVLVLELRPPHDGTFEALLALWPTAVSYAVSYLFIAIVWVNHHHLLRYASTATPHLIWSNFAHLFTVSLIPFSTAWIADTKLAAAPVSVYAAVFVLVNATYLALCWEVVDRPPTTELAPRARMMMRVRSIVTLALFLAASLIALKYPVGGMAMICLCLLVYLRPDAPGSSAQ
jgi:uncharacterized membrane protein